MKLDSIQAKFDKDLIGLFHKLKKHENVILNRPAKNGDWSVVQNLEHLILSEKLSHQYLLKKLQDPSSVPPKSIILVYRKIKLFFYLHSPFKFKAPKIVNEEAFPSEGDFWDISKRWKNQRAEFFDYLHSLPPDLLEKQIYKHPVAGRLNCDGMLSFINWHFHRHIKQIDKILKDYQYKI